MSVPKDYDGILRAKITILSLSSVKVEWFNVDTKEVVWTEESTLIDGAVSVVSQIECTGHFKTVVGYFVDDRGLRHFVMNAETGHLGTVLGATDHASGAR